MSPTNVSRHPFLFVTFLAACAPAGEGEVSEPAPPVASAAAAAPAAAPRPVGERDVAVLALEQGPNGLTVTSSARVERARLGPAATWNGRGRATHRFVLVDASGATLAEGEVAARRDLHVAPSAGGPAAHAVPGSFAFVVRAPYPEPGEHLEVHALDETKLVARWP